MLEHGHGLQNGFHGLWVESDDLNELSRLLRVDPDSRRQCDLETALGMYEGQWGKADVWMGPHAPGWTHILAFGLYPGHPAVLGLGPRRVFEIFCCEELGKLDPVRLYEDGRQVGDITPPYREGGVMESPEYLPYTRGLALGDTRNLKRDLHLMMCVAGRITGRFLDRDWFTSSRPFYRIPEERW
ncbi:hypothetical protein [Nonomuraea rhizosphaerae]|uniref:hypothetical protein n=1 Tax=Nonomuraea rhizosphaerae TaxID=2665663 RepID=UPI001C5D1819|nr:hypothetical protein [Nonomuraea rhizosphaerae]